MTASRSVLIVEDEPLISMMLEDFLDSLGHQVAGTCDNVPDALGRVEHASSTGATFRRLAMFPGHREFESRHPPRRGGPFARAEGHTGWCDGLSPQAGADGRG